MPQRITEKLLIELSESVAEYTHLPIEIGFSYGYVQVNETIGDSGAILQLESGTNREMYMFLRGMQAAVTLMNKQKK